MYFGKHWRPWWNVVYVIALSHKNQLVYDTSQQLFFSSIKGILKQGHDLIATGSNHLDTHCAMPSWTKMPAYSVSEYLSFSYKWTHNKTLWYKFSDFDSNKTLWYKFSDFESNSLQLATRNLQLATRNLQLALYLVPTGSGFVYIVPQCWADGKNFKKWQGMHSCGKMDVNQVEWMFLSPLCPFMPCLSRNRDSFYQFYPSLEKARLTTSLNSPERQVNL